MPDDFTNLLMRMATGDKDAESQLAGIVHAELRRLASWHLRRERRGHTLQPTALVHEAYLRLIPQQAVSWRDRAHFFAVASQIMRRVLVDYARHRTAEKRGGPNEPIRIDDCVLLTSNRDPMILAVDEALSRLTKIDPRQGQIVEMRFFGGLTEEEIAILLGVSTRTVKRDWVLARAWLHAELSRAED